MERDGHAQHLASVLASTTSIAGLVGLAVLSSILYNLLLHPLRHIPGPAWAKISPLPMYAISLLGNEGRFLRYYHQHLRSKVLRISPNGVSISDDAAIHDVYVAGGGLIKDQRYSNFNMGSVVTIFSSQETAYRDFRAKAVASLFSPRRLQGASAPEGIIGQSVSTFVQQLVEFRQECEARKVGKVDILDRSARLALDVVTGYLFNTPFGGLSEDKGKPLVAQMEAKLSINPFILAVLAGSRFSLLPHWLFAMVYTVFLKFRVTDTVSKCFARMSAFSLRLVNQAMDAKTAEQKDRYDARLLGLGLSSEEVQAQCQAVIFAGTDSTAVKLATVLFHLTQNQGCLKKLHEELDGKKFESADAFPYLRAAVKEGLRVAVANPTRQTRVVSRKGLLVDGTYIPGDTVVGAAAYVLHHDPEIFPDPFAYRPERWLEMDDCNRSRMERSLLMFGAGLRSCLGKSLAQQLLHEAIVAIVKSRVLEGAKTVQESIELVEWYNAEIKHHTLEVQWPSSKSEP